MKVDDSLPPIQLTCLQESASARGDGDVTQIMRSEETKLSTIAN
jgi:hypothetical protein